MVIGFDASRAFESERTGTESYSYHLLKGLAKIDRRNKYLIYTRPHNISSMIIELMKQFPKNFSLVRINWPRFWTQGGMALQTFKDEIDVLFTPAHTLPIIRRPGLKTVMTVHDLGAEYLPTLHRLKQRLYLKIITRYQLTSATRLIAVSYATKKDLVKRGGVDPEKIKVVYEGYDREKFKSQKSKLKSDILSNTLESYDLVPSSYFLFVGTIQPRKNLTKLIQAFNQFCHPEGVKRPKDLKLMIVGPKGWLADEIYRLPKQLGIEKRVKFLGYVPDQDMLALYSGAIALTFPSLFEGFGLPILEAQACGCPVITSNISSMPEVAGKGAILVDPYDVDDIVKGMERLPASRGEQVTGYREQLVKKGFENVKKFSWEKCAAQTLEVFENL